MAHWFDPVLLLKLLNNVVVSSMFGQYADRRLIIAALDTVSPGEHAKRAKDFRSRLTADKDGGVWIDWVADLGDGFDSTYAVASLLARKELKVSDIPLPRGQALIMGGDEVYPKASRQAYMNQLRQPYLGPRPTMTGKTTREGRCSRSPAITTGTTGWCSSSPTSARKSRGTSAHGAPISVAATSQSRSLRPGGCGRPTSSSPQADYFKHIAASMPENSKIILCSAEPGWLYTDSNRKSWEIMEYAAGIALNAGRGHTIPLLLSGDTHHYSRYVGKDERQYVTSGGGGAFLHPTHQLEQNFRSASSITARR
jgi:hypothetical protein